MSGILARWPEAQFRVRNLGLIAPEALTVDMQPGRIARFAPEGLMELRQQSDVKFAWFEQYRDTQRQE